MKRLLLGTAVWLLAGPAHAETINILMESLPFLRKYLIKGLSLGALK